MTNDESDDDEKRSLTGAKKADTPDEDPREDCSDSEE